jgi:glutamate dehydrogenase (NAD(P)+)
MGVTVSDVQQIYAGAGVENRRSGLFERNLDGDPASYHFTGYGVVTAFEAAAARTGLAFPGATVAIEGFGQVGVGVARYATELGAKVVAISTVRGAVYDPGGLDIPWFLEARRTCGDDCVNEYEHGEKLPSSDIYFLPVDVLVPGARPYVITPDNVERIRAKLVVSGGNISVTREADEMLFRRGIISVPDFIANSGGMIASLVDFHGGTPDQAFNAIKKRISPRTLEVLAEADKSDLTPYAVATARVKQSIREQRNKPRRSFADTLAQIKDMLEI